MKNEELKLTAEELAELKAELTAMNDQLSTKHERGIAEQRLADLLWAHGPKLIAAAEEAPLLSNAINIIRYRGQDIHLDELLAENARLKAQVGSFLNIEELGRNIGYGSAITREIERLQTSRDLAFKEYQRVQKDNERLQRENEMNAFQISPAMYEAKIEQLNARIDALTEYLRHGPNCPADVSNLTGLVPGKCDCGLMQLVAAAGRDGTPLPSETGAQGTARPTAITPPKILGDLKQYGSVEPEADELEFRIQPVKLVCGLTPFEQVQKDYNELLMQVERAWPGETRHQTALRYIREAERNAALCREAAENLTAPPPTHPAAVIDAPLQRESQTP